jgi:hypothetical protein
MKRLPFLLLAGFLVLPNFPSVAQSPEVPQRLPDGGTRDVLISILIPSLPNEPFAATVHTEWIRPLADGSTITLKNHRAIARDSEGRIFQERRALVADDSQQSPITQIEISDPVSHELYICVPQSLVCQVEVFSPPEDAHLPPGVVPTNAAGSPKVEDLGTQYIGGLEAVGARKTEFFQVGKMGNDRPLAAKWEFWYSPMLGINLISKREDPRFGTQNFEVTDIVLGEPDPNLFELPSGSKIIDLRKPPVISSPGAPPSN